MGTPRDPAWRPPKCKAAPPPSLGATAYTSTGRPRKMPRAQAALAQHGSCVDHLEVEGLRHKICVLRGQDPARVVAEARQLAGLE